MADGAVVERLHEDLIATDTGRTTRLQVRTQWIRRGGIRNCSRNAFTRATVPAHALPGG